MTDDGAILTGDLGRIDEHGRVFLTGRLKDLIISGGLNVAPAEIEAVACEHPGVLSAVVVGIPDERWGETPVVVAVPARGNGLAADDVLRHCRESLTPFKRPSAAALVDALPSTGIGKSAKSVIRRRILDGEIELVRAD
jgi:acyl-CoA synthetase (AMP-forming)/AMP-acid ligase II